jgi:hypothetical protein
LTTDQIVSESNLSVVNTLCLFKHQTLLDMKILLRLPIGIMILLMFSILSCKKENQTSDNLTPAKLALDKLAQKKPKHPKPHSAVYGLVTTFAGNGIPEDIDGKGTRASFSSPLSVATDADGNIYVNGDSRIRKITPNGLVTNFAGTGVAGSADGYRTSATFSEPAGMAFGPDGSMYVADPNNRKIRKISTNGIVSTFAGSGTRGHDDGTASQATFDGPTGLVADGHGNVYVADGRLLRKITPGGVVTTLAGNIAAPMGDSPLYIDGIGTAASFDFISCLAMDAEGNIYAGDGIFYSVIRKITPEGVVTTFAGNSNGAIGSTDGPVLSATFGGILSLASDSAGNLYVSQFNNVIREITPSNLVSTPIGNGLAGSTDGIGTAASFNDPTGITIDNDDNMYVADWQNFLIRKVIVEP